MSKHLKFLLAITLVIALFSSCKKTTDVGTLTGHKWSLTSANETYSDSVVTNSLLQVQRTCTTTSYIEFANYAANSPLRLYYTYTTTNCPGQVSSPIVATNS